MNAKCFTPRTASARYTISSLCSIQQNVKGGEVQDFCATFDFENAKSSTLQENNPEIVFAHGWHDLSRSSNGFKMCFSLFFLVGGKKTKPNKNLNM